MQMNYQDAMAIVRKHKKPDLFITFTCNPNWPEILRELRGSEPAWARKDLIVRVFHIKLKQLLDDLLNKHVLGKPVAYLHVIEFQKRGLPHAHILLILAAEDKPRTVDDYDTIVCAEIPSLEQPLLREIVLKSMIHGPCGQLNPNCVCMVNGKCIKRFPKVCNPATKISEDSYPEYRRRNLNTPHTTNKGQVLGDEWVVPYNPYLSKKYEAHINVEICNSKVSL